MSKSYADISLSPALAQFQHRRQSPSGAAPPTGSGSGSGSYTSPYHSLAALRNLPRRSLIRIAVLLALGIPLALLLAGSSPFAFPNASSSAGVGSGTGAGAGAYGQKRSDTGLAWNRPPGGGEGRGIGGFWGFGSSGSRSGVDHDGGRGQGAGGGEAVLDLVESMPLTTFDGGLAGYTVFSNLYLSSGAFLHVSEPPSTLEEGVPPRPLDVQNSDTPTAADPMDRWAKKGSKSTGKSSSVQVDTQRPPLPHARQIMSGPRTPDGRYEAAGEERWRVVDQTVAQGELGERAVYLSGVTYIFNDEAGDTGYLVYFKHFVLEAFLGATRSLAHVLKHTGRLAGVNGAEKAIPLPERIWFPRCGARPSWRDGKGENVWFLHHALPGVQIEDASGFADRAAAGLPVIFERAVIIDRWSAHSVGGESAAWGKMNADVASLSAPAHFWDGIKGNFMRSLGVDGPSRIGTGQRGLPVVVYIDGQTGSSKLSAASHAALVQALKGLTGVAEVHVTKLGAMKRPQQLDLMGRTHIVIAAHTDDLFNALWMPASEKSAVIELFEEGGFDRSFELLATALNHRYVAVQKDKVLTEAEWRAVGSHRGETATSGFEIDGALVAKTIETILRGPVEGSSVEDR